MYPLKTNISNLMKAHKINEKIIRPLATLCFCFLTFTQTVNAQDGEAIFKQNCGVCHRVGGGKLVGPDLLGVTTKRSADWLMKWTKSSQALVNSGDADAKSIFEEYNKLVMPDQTISEADIKVIFDFIAAKSSVASETAATDTAKKQVVPDASNNATAAEIELGRNIFNGSRSLTNGGPSCISCHNVNYKDMLPGGLLAKDLTSVYSRLGGDAGILGILGAPPFPAMTQSYKDRPLTEIEIAALSAFFNKVDKDKPNQIINTTNPLLMGGGAGLGVIVVMISLIWYKRKTVTVKKDIYDRQIKST